MQLPPHRAGLLVSCDLQRKMKNKPGVLVRRVHYCRVGCVLRQYTGGGGMTQIARLVVCMLMIRSERSSGIWSVLVCAHRARRDS